MIYPWNEFANLLVNAIYDDSFLRQMTYTNEVTVHVIGHLNRHDCSMWGQE